MLTGCAAAPRTTPVPPLSPATPSRPALPPRPAELSLDEIDPCTLLTTEQRTQLNLDRGVPTPEATEPNCNWNDLSAPPLTAVWGADVYLHQGADYALGSTTGVRVVSVDGFPAVETVGGFDNPADSCVVVIDVAQGQSLHAAYGGDVNRQPGITHDQACRHARDLAQALLQTLSTLKR